jgi:hypothetical protein
MAFAKAERTNLFLRCALFGPSGSGKTMTALRMAKGIADKMGVPYAVIDTEARSASKYADRFDFIVDDLESKTIDDYLKSMEEAKKEGYKVLVIDSLTHAWWELTDEKDRIAQSSTNKNALSPWAKLNPKQKRFIYAILNYPGHIIATMRSKTEWVIGEGKNGKTAPEKIGLAPEQGKGIEFEFDMLVELTQRHEATVTKDRTGKFQDEIIEKPGEEFGVALYNWLSSGKAVIAKNEIPPAPADKTPPKPQKAVAPPAKQKTEKPAKEPAKGANLKEQGDGIIKEIGAIITAANNGSPYFSEDEKEGARDIIKGTRLDEKGIADLRDFKAFLSEELSKRETKKAA